MDKAKCGGTVKHRRRIPFVWKKEKVKMGYQPKHKNNKTLRRRFVVVLVIFLLLTFTWSAVKLIQGLVDAKKEQDSFSALAEIVARNTNSGEPSVVQKKADQPAHKEESAEKTEPDPTMTQTIDETQPETDEQRERTILPQYKELAEMNPELLGWISIEGTSIDYPVMYSPDRPEYYLDHAFDGSESSYGVPFADFRCPVDGNYFLIYGHHMHNKTMFAQLLQYDSERFYEEHPVFRFDTIYEEREYQVMAAFKSRVYRDEEKNVFRYYRYFDLSQEEVFAEYVQQVLALAKYDTGVTAEYGDELIALSTCSYHESNGRFVLVAKRVA